MIVVAQPGHTDSISEKARRWFAGHGCVQQYAQMGDTSLWFDSRRCTHAGRTVLDGWIDNAPELARTLSLNGRNAAALYDAAVAHWGDDADQHIVGQYAALTVLGDGVLRLSRSPWAAPPISIIEHASGVCIASLPSAFTALGANLTLNRSSVIDQLAMDSGGASYEGVRRVHLGSVLRWEAGQIHEHRWYKVDAIRPAPERTDAERIARCEALLDDAARAAWTMASKPALALSGGLDSPIVADALLKAEPDRALASFTMVPDPEWRSGDAPGTIGNEWPVVERFAARHPRLQARQADPVHGGFDYRYREVAKTAGTFNAAQSLLGPHHAIWEAAKGGGHDWLLTADLGNQSFSADGRWAYAEWFRQGRWRQFAQLINARRDDRRPLWRKVLGLGLVPHLPTALRAWLQVRLGGGAAKADADGCMLSGKARADYQARAAMRGSRPAWSGFAFARSRSDAARRDWEQQCHEAAEITLALELKYGVRYRDVTAYRPLIEYCLSLPTEMFARNGTTRWLARQLAQGRMPQAQIDEALHGLHHVDWLVRMRRDARRFRQQIGAMRGHAWLAETLDLDRMERLLDQLPDEASENIFDALPYIHGVARAIVAGQWIGLNEGRNDF